MYRTVSRRGGYGGRWTQVDITAHMTAYLSDERRCGHLWAEMTGGTRCMMCDRKYGKSAGRLCPKRTRPNRWRIHWQRALNAEKYPREIPKRDASWLLNAMRTIEDEAKRSNHDERWWAYAKPARQYRKYLREWWALPAAQTSAALRVQNTSHDRWAAGFTRGRNKLIQRVRAEQVRTIQDGACVYTFYAHAHENGTPLFREESA